jgi:hypothetical protein
MIYFVHLDQGGEGCDYTIGCGHSLQRLKAGSIDAARAEVEALIAEDYSSEMTEVAHVKILEVATVLELDVAAHYQALKEQQRVAEAARRLKSEREEFERLKQKFGGDAA